MKKFSAIFLTAILMLSAFAFVATPDNASAISKFGVKSIGAAPKPGTFVGPTWLASEGNRIYVVEEVAFRVQAVLKGATTQFLYGTQGNHEDQITEPGGFFPYKEKMYWLDRAQGKIIVRGNRQDSPYEKEIEVLDQDRKRTLKYANGIWIDQNKIYIANTGAGNVIVCDVTGKYAATIGKKGTGDGELSKPTGVCVIGDKLYVTDPALSRISVFGLDGKFISNFGSGSPWAITAHENRLYVTDSVAGKVNVFGADGASVTSFGSPGSGQGQLGNPKGITILDGKCYVSSFSNNRVDIFELDGKHIGILGLPVEQAASSFGRPSGLAISGNNVIVSDSARNKIITYTLDGSYVSEFGSFGAGDRQLANPTGVAADSSGNIYVADTGNNCVKVFDNTGAYKRTIGSQGNGNGKFSNPSDVAVASSVNKMFVSDTGNNLVQIFSLSGEFLGQFGGFGNAQGQFNNPMGIATDGRKVLVADAANCRIQEFTIDGKPVRSFGQRGRGRNQLFFPSDVAYDLSGKIYVTDTYNDRIVCFDNTSKRSWLFGRTGGPGRAIYFSKSGEENEDPGDEDIKTALGFFSFPAAIACDQGFVVVGDTYNMRLQTVPYDTIFNYPRIDTETFIPQPNLVTWYTVAPSILDFGVMPVGETQTRKIEIRNWTGGLLTGKVTIIQDSPFLSVDPANFVGDITILNVKCDTTGMTAGTAMKATLVINTNKGESRVEVTVTPSDGYGFALSNESSLFVEMECKNPASIEIAVNPQNGYDKTVNLSYTMPAKKCVLPKEPDGSYKVVENVDCKGFELSSLTVEFKPSTIKFKETNKATMTLVPKGNVTPGIYEIILTMSGSGAVNKESKFSIILLVNPCIDPTNDKSVPRNLLTETFTAVWCQYCPYHREAQYRMYEEYGPWDIIPLAYYADAPTDNSGMTQEENHYRYRWYTQEGLPTTMFNGVWNFSEGDKPFERQKRPPDTLPDRKMSGSSFSYWRFKHRTETYRHMTSPIELFLQADGDGNEGTATLEINTIGDVSGFKDLNVYFVLVENNIIFPATNGENEHSLTVMKFLHDKSIKKSPKEAALGDPISLSEGVATSRSITFEFPAKTFDWKGILKHYMVVAWIQDNTKKEILQSTMVDFNQSLLYKYSFRQINGQSTGVQAGAKANFKYILTNLGNYHMAFTLDMNNIGGQPWQSTLLVDKVPTAQGTNIVLDPMQSSLIELSVEVPPDAAEGSVSQFKLNVNELTNGNATSSELRLTVEPAKPPSFELSSHTKFVEVEPGGDASFNILVSPINEYNNPVTLDLSKESSKYFKAKFEPANGVPPFESKVTLTVSEELEYFEDGYKVVILAAGSDSKGDKIQKDLTLKSNAKLVSLTLKPERKVITSCAINDVCRQTEIKINVEGDVSIKEARIDFIFDNRYLEVTNVSLGSLMSRQGEIAIMNYDIKPDRVVMKIKRDKAVLPDQNENTLASVTLKAAGDKIEIDNVRIGLENVMLIGQKGNKSLATAKDETLSIRKNALPPKIHLINPLQKDSPWPTEKEYERRIENKLLNFFDLRTKENNVKVSGKCESEEGISQLTLFVAGQKVPMASDGTFEINYTLKEGYNNIIIVAQNYTGETDGIMIVVVLDTLPPDLVIDKPEDDLVDLNYNMKTSQNSVEFHGYTDAEAKITIMGKPVQVREDKFIEDQSKRYFFYEKIPLLKGLNEINISACDDMGNCRDYTYKVTYDPNATPPPSKTVKIELWIDKTDMIVNGVKSTLKTAPTASSPPLPKDFKGTTFMPIADVAKALNVPVGWDANERRVDLTQTLPDGSKKSIQLWINGKNAKIDGKWIPIDSKGKLFPTIVGGKTVLPLRFVGEALGCLIEYEAKTKKITLTYPKP